MERMQHDDTPILGLRETRGPDELVYGVQFSCRGRAVDARLDLPRREWQVRVDQRPVGRVDALETEDARTVAEVLVAVYLEP